MLFKIIVTIFTIFCSKAYTEYHHDHGKTLQTIPDLESYGKIEYPHFDIIDLGSYHKGHLPPKVIHVTKKIVIKEPRPYPVKVPYPVPYPVPHKVPYPVIHKELVKVPEPVPYPVSKTVHVPIEVPKPYPVPVHEYKGSGSGETSYGGQQDDGGYNQNQHTQDNSGGQDTYSNEPVVYGVPGHVPGQPLSLEEHQNNNYQVNYQVSHETDYSGHQDQSVNYAAFQVPLQQTDAKPVQERQQETAKH